MDGNNKEIPEGERAWKKGPRMERIWDVIITVGI